MLWWVPTCRCCRVPRTWHGTLQQCRVALKRHIKCKALNHLAFTRSKPHNGL